MITWGYTVHWTEFPNRHREVTAGGRSSQEEARSDAFKLAASFGWTPRKWWQFWRCGDT